jgi:predicted RND superfamily exporter protein
MRNLVVRFCNYYLNRPVISALIALAIFACGAFFASRLQVNSNQLDLLPENLRSVQEARRVGRMIGGAGFVILTFRKSERDAGDKIFYEALAAKRASQDDRADTLLARAEAEYKKLQPENQKDIPELKKAVEEMNAALEALPEIQYTEYKVDLSPVLQRIHFFVRTPDLREGLRRLGKKRDDMVERANPFFIDLGQPAYQLRMDDLVDKYRRVGKKEIDDDYYVSPDRKMLTMLAKPTFSLQEIAQSRELIETVRRIAAEKNFEARGIEVGFTGSYVLYVDAYDSINRSITPTLIYALIGVSIVLIAFIHRVSLIAAMLLALVYSIVLTFGLTYLVIGELNLITSMFGGILAGLGIDFGIHLIGRFKEEYAENPNFIPAMIESILHTGKAATYSALTTTAAFISLIVSDFKGFSHLGTMSAYGILITSLSMFFVVPLILALAIKIYPNLLKKYAAKDRDHTVEDRFNAKFNAPRLSRVALYSMLTVVVGAAIFVPRVQWDNDARNMLDYNIPSEVLQDEIALRYDVVGTPVVVAQTETDEVRALWEHFEPLTESQDRILAQVLSVFAFVPPVHQQRANYNLVQQFRRDSAAVQKSLIPPAYQNYWGDYQRMVARRPFELKDVPEDLQSQFRNIPDAPEQGWLTYIYPEVSRLYRQEGLVELEEIVGEIEFPVLGGQSLLNLAYYLPTWERANRERIDGARKRMDVKVAGDRTIKLSEREINGILAQANKASPQELNAAGLSELGVNKTIANRPFESLADLQQEKLSAYGTGSVVLVARFTYIVLQETRYLLVSTVLLVLLILYASFRNIISSLMVLLPLVSGSILMVGLMSALGVKLNYFNVSVLPIVIGYGIDNGIFVFYRYVESGSIFRTLYHTGHAALASSLTSLAGWGSLALAGHPGIQSMGILACLGLSSMMIMTLIMFPAVLRIFAEKRPEFFDGLRKRYAIPPQSTVAATTESNT